MCCRLHDVGKTAWMIVIVNVVTFIVIMILAVMTGVIASNNPSGEPPLILLLLFILAINIPTTYMAIVDAKPGQPGKNKWGPQPKEVYQPSFINQSNNDSQYM